MKTTRSILSLTPSGDPLVKGPNKIPPGATGVFVGIAQMPSAVRALRIALPSGEPEGLYVVNVTAGVQPLTVNTPRLPLRAFVEACRDGTALPMDVPHLQISQALAVYVTNERDNPVVLEMYAEVDDAPIVEEARRRERSERHAAVQALAEGIFARKLVRETFEDTTRLRDWSWEEAQKALAFFEAQEP